MNIKFIKLTEPTTKIAESFTRWENDPSLTHLIRPNPNEEALHNLETVSTEDLVKRLEHNHIFLIYIDDQLIGEMDYQVDPKHLYKKETGTAWIGIIIGEEAGRGKGIGYQSIRYLEEQIRLNGLKRVELGVFEFNENAIRLYKKLGYKEFARINDFTYWEGKMWQDIRMEKYL